MGAAVGLKGREAGESRGCVLGEGITKNDVISRGDSFHTRRRKRKGGSPCGKRIWKANEWNEWGDGILFMCSRVMMRNGLTEEPQTEKSALAVLLMPSHTQIRSAMFTASECVSGTPLAHR
jgi:hypothetical protein